MPIERLNDFSGGMVDQRQPDRLSVNEVAYLENMEYRDGTLRTRRGSVLSREAVTGEVFQGAGLFNNAFDTADNEVMLIAQGDQTVTADVFANSGKIYHYQYPFEPFSMTLPETLVPIDKVRFIQALTYIYIFRGDGRDVWRWDGQSTSLIETLPAATISAFQMQGARTGKYIFNRLWLVSGTDTLNIADSLAETIDYANNSIDISRGEGQKLIGIHKFGEQSILAFKERGIAIISGGAGAITNAATDLTIDFIDESYGCVSEDTIVSVGADVWFFSTRGVMSIGENEQQKLQLIQTPISEPIKELMNRINMAPDAISQSSAVLHDNYYMLSVPIDGSTRPNAIFAYDFITASWVGLWRLRDSTGALLDASNLPVYQMSRLLEYRYNGQDRIAAIGHEGEFLQLLSSRFDNDFENNGSYYLSLSGADEVQLVDIITETAYEDQLKGIIEVRFRITALPTGASGNLIQMIGASPDRLIIDISTAGVISASLILAAIEWNFIGDTALTLNEWHTFTFLHDGATPSMYVDTKLEDITFITVTDVTKWITDITGPITAVDMDTTNGLEYDLEFVSFQEYTGTPATSGRGAVVAHFPLNEGTGTAVAASNDSAIIGTFTGTPTWSTPTLPAPIHTSLKTRDFFGDLPSDKLITQGEVTFTHANPKVSATLLTPGGYDDETEFTDYTYDETKYDIANHIDYVTSNVNGDHNDEGRKNYMPIAMPVAGVANPVAGIRLNREVERTENLFGNIVHQRVGIQIDNTQGHIGIRELVLDNVDNGIGNRRSLG